MPLYKQVLHSLISIFVVISVNFLPFYKNFIFSPIILPEIVVWGGVENSFKCYTDVNKEVPYQIKRRLLI